MMGQTDLNSGLMGYGADPYSDNIVKRDDQEDYEDE